MFTVVGAGFGIYGYLPALVEAFGEPVILPREYQRVVMARPELERFRVHIRWADDVAAALGQASGVVVAVRPGSQPEVIRRCCEIAGITRVVLEKPVAATPALAAGVLETLERSAKRYRIGYTLLETPWSRAWGARRQGLPLRIDWTFMAHHFAQSLQTWKRAHSQGGGALRFYGIHMIALLAHRGYREVAESTLAGAHDEPAEWTARFSGPRLPECRLRIDSRSEETAFRISSGGQPWIDLRDPFAAASPAHPAAGGDDRRIPVLAELLRTFRFDDSAHYALYRHAQALWQAVEEATVFETGDVR